MTTFAPHRDTLKSFVDCINGGADKDTLTRLLAENVVLYGPFGNEPIAGRETAVETIKTVNGLSSDDTYMEVLSGETHHAAHFRLQVGDAAVNGIFFVLLDADGKIAEVSIFYRTLPAGVALQRNLADVIGMQPWELRTNEAGRGGPLRRHHRPPRQTQLDIVWLIGTTTFWGSAGQPTLGG
ncbi:MAG: hypothetical protein QOK45_863 [Mycobacterium sp.]|nr:hypothetical protein [Mycobacterium sp.]